jgi:type II secretory pathway pseudopilin PulG
MKTLHQFDRQPALRGITPQASPVAGEEGFMLLAVVVMVMLVIIALGVAAPVVARQLRRDKELESEHRMEQYVRAIQLYQRKFPGQYPASIKVLEGTNNIRFLRHVYIDPLTGKADYKLIHQGEQKTKIHVFFGQELEGLSASLGSAAGMTSAGGTGSTLGSGIGSPLGGGATSVTSTNALNSGFGGATLGTSDPSSTTGTNGTNGAAGIGASSSGTNGTSPLGDGSGGVIVGVGTAKSGDSISEPNGQTTYESWEFWYDPRIEMLKKAVSITGGGMSSQSASSFGQGLNGQPNSGAQGPGGISGINSPTGFPGSTGSNGMNGTNGSNGTSGTNGTNGTNGSGGTTSNPNSSTPNPF